MNIIISIICFLVILSIIVLVHEFGHFFFAKLFGVYVYEFSLGMGPLLFTKKDKKGETSYSIRLIPLGGYVQLAGEGLEEDEKLPKDRLLQSKKPWQRFLIMFFGAGNNFILALVTLFLLGVIWGSPSNSTVIPGVIPESPAALAGIMPGDKIVKINDSSIKTFDDLQLYLAVYKNEEIIHFTVLRDNKEETVDVVPLTEEEQAEKQYSIGINLVNERNHGFINAIKYSFTKFYSLTRQIVLTFKELFTGHVSLNDMSGPLGIYQAVDTSRAESNGLSETLANLMYLMALLCINVGFINIVPFPAFDGGHILFIIIEMIRRKPIKQETENMIHNIGFFILIGLIIYITGFDILRLIKK